MPTALEEEFYQEMVNIYIRAKDEVAYLATRYLQMVNEHGGVTTAKILINSEKPSDGYTALWELGRLDLTVEALVQDSKWATLFRPEEIERARQRLKKYGYI